MAAWRGGGTGKDIKLYSPALTFLNTLFSKNIHMYKITELK
jgi:hypothetical protein